MKTFLPQCALFIAAAISTLSAHADLNSDFETLQAQRKDAIVQATGTVDQRFVAAFQNLLKQAVQTQDFETAAKIKSKLDSLRQATDFMQTDTPIARKQLSDYLIAHDWTWVDLYPKNHVRYHFRLSADGKIVHDANANWNWSSDNFRRWEVVSGDEFRVIQLNGVSVFFIVDFKNNALTMDKEKTEKDHQDKQILYGDQTHLPETIGTDSNAHYFGTKTVQ